MVPGRGVSLLLSALGGVVLGSAATLLLTAGPGPTPATMLAGTSQHMPSEASAPDSNAPATLEEAAARQALSARLRNPDTLRLQEVRVWQFGPSDERAVCGVMQSPELAGGSARFIVRILQPRGYADGGSRTPQTVVEEAPWLVRPSPEAARRFCRDAEPPPLPAPAALAPRPGPPAAASGVTEAAATAPASPSTPTGPVLLPDGSRLRVTTHSPANLRAAPSGEVLFSVPRGRSLVVFDRAPGGWMQVGETTPEGWIHSSLLSDSAPP
jgi:hypothetical protein